MNDVKEKTLYLIQFWARFFKNNADYPNFYGFYQMVVNVGVEFPPYNQSPYANKKKRIKKTGALEEANPWDYYIQMKEEEQMNYGGRIGDTGMGPTEAKGFDARAEKLKADLEVVVNNIDLTNNIIDNCIEERRMDELLPEMILTLEGLNQKLNKLVEQLTDKEEERLFNLVLLIIEDINTTKGRYKDLTSRKRPQPFISAYKNSPENDDDHVEAQPKPPVAKPPARKQFGDEEEEEGPGYNQFQFQDDDDDEDEKDNFPRQRAGPPQIPGPAQRPQQPIQQPPQPQRQSQPAFKPTFEGFDNPGQSNFFDTPAAPARGPVQEAPRPAPAKPRQPELDLLGTDAPAGGVKEPPKTGGGVDLLDLGAPAAKPQPQLGMAGMGMMGGPGMMPGAGMMGTPGFGVPGMGGVNPMYGMGMAGIPGMGGMGVAPGMGVNPLMSGPMGLAMSMNPTQPNLLANTGPKLGEKNEIKFSKEVKPDLAKANEPEKYTGNLADIDAMSKDILGSKELL